MQVNVLQLSDNFSQCFLQPSFASQQQGEFNRMLACWQQIQWSEKAVHFLLGPFWKDAGRPTGVVRAHHKTSRGWDGMNSWGFYDKIEAN